MLLKVALEAFRLESHQPWNEVIQPFSWEQSILRSKMAAALGNPFHAKLCSDTFRATPRPGPWLSRISSHS